MQKCLATTRQCGVQKQMASADRRLVVGIEQLCVMKGRRMRWRLCKMGSSEDTVNNGAVHL